MASLQELAERAAKMPSQGQASSYGELKLRTQPSSAAPSFLQIRRPRSSPCCHDCLAAHRPARAPLVFPAPPKKAAKKEDAKGKVPPPPCRSRHRLRTDWLELSGRDPDEPAPEPESRPSGAGGLDYWSLCAFRPGKPDGC